ncbi:MAG: DUF5719 family protein, partial [Actinomycetota bacterium]
AGPATPLAAPSPEALSSVWFCPHGGGDGWTATISIANPGASDVRVRLRSLDDRGSGEPVTFVVPAGHEVQREVPDASLASATVVEAFGGWVSAGWIVRAADPDVGIGAEPCAPAAGRSWLAPGASTQQGEQATLIVMNPFAEAAVFDVVLYSSRPALRAHALTDVVLGAGRSVAIPITKRLVDEAAVGAEVDAKVGRIAVATLGVTVGGGVRSVLGTTAASATIDLPTAAGSGQSSLQVVDPGSEDAHFSATAWASDGPAPAGGLLSQEHRASSGTAYPVMTSGPAVVSVSAQGADLFAALRSQGQSDDDAAAGGTATPVSAWVVPPTVADQPSNPGLLVANPGSAPVQVTLRLLPPGTGTVARPTVSFTVAASSTAAAPAAFLDQSPSASVLVTANGEVVAAGASTSGGVLGLSLYGVALGVAVPEEMSLPA